MRRLRFAIATSTIVDGAWIAVAAQRAGAVPDEVVLFAENLMVPMRDGVRLATDVYRPARGGTPLDEKLPLLLHRTGYNKKGAGLVRQARTFAAHGYVVAVQDDRGTYKSEGVQYKYVGWGRDGYDTIEWLARLPYTNGSVGMWGTSYAAHTQASAAILNPPHLKTIVLNMGGLYNGWHHKIRNHGAFELAQQVGWAFAQLGEQTNDPTVHDMMQHEKAADWVGALRARKGLTPLAAAPNFESYIFDMLTRADYDTYWRQGDLNWSEHYGESADIPMIHISGWYDPYTAGAINNFVGLSKIKKAPVRLLVGPWLHARNTSTSAGEVEFGPDAAIADFSDAFHLRWFDTFLKGASTGVIDEPRVKLFVMGTGDGHKDPNGRLYHGGFWKTAGDWPLPQTNYIRYYFQPDGTLGPDHPRSGAPPTVYSYDPRSPVPTIGGSFTTQAGLVAGGAFDQRERPFIGDPTKGFFGSTPPYLPLSARNDVLVFQTEPLKEQMEVVGPRFDVNPNTGEPLGLSRRTVVADNSIWHDREHPSHIVLPVVRTSRDISRRDP